MEFLETARLYLRPWSPADAPALWALAAAEDCSFVLGAACPADEADSRRAASALALGDIDFALENKETERVVGILSIPHRHPAGVEPELPYRTMTFALLPEFRDRGLMREAVTEMVRHAFEDIGVGMLWSCWPEGNLSARRLLEAHSFCPALDQTDGERLLHHMTLTWESWVDQREDERIFELLLSSYY